MIDVTVGGEDPNELNWTEENKVQQDSNPTSQPTRDSESGGVKPQWFHTFTAMAFFAAALLLYIILSLMSINEKYVDFGDGNYLYLSWRLAEGDVLYKDLPSPQPPLLLFMGAFWLWLGGGEVALLRLWQVVLHCLTACCVWGISQRVFQWHGLSSLAGIIYLYLPIGLWWATGYQSEPLLVMLQCFNIMLYLDAVQKNKPTFTLMAAAVVAVLTAFTNMTALPYILLQWFFTWYLFRPLFTRYTLTLVTTGLLGLIFMYFYSDGQYFYHVFARQVGTYPQDSLNQAFTYFAGKLINEGRDILVYEGGFIIASMMGILLYAGDEDRRHPAKDYIVWWAIFAIGSVIFLTKGGTVDYIFTIGEPAVAVFSAFLFSTLVLASDLHLKIRQWFTSALDLGKVTLIVCLFLPALLMMPLVMNNWVFTSSARLFELSEFSVKKSTSYIQRNSSEDDMMVAPPYYAFHARRKLVENSSSLFILAHAYFNEYKQLVKDENLNLNIPLLSELNPQNMSNPYAIGGGTVQFTTQHIYDLSDMFDNNPALRGRYPAVALFLDMRKKMINGEVPIVYANTRHLFYAVPPLHEAIRDFYNQQNFEFSQTGTLENRNREELITVYKRKP